MPVILLEDIEQIEGSLQHNNSTWNRRNQRQPPKNMPIHSRYIVERNDSMNSGRSNMPNNKTIAPVENNSTVTEDNYSFSEEIVVFNNNEIVEENDIAASSFYDDFIGYCSSLPSHEDAIRTDSIIANVKRRQKKLKWIWSVVCFNIVVIILVSIITVSVRGRQKHNEQKMSSSSTNTTASIFNTTTTGRHSDYAAVMMYLVNNGVSAFADLSRVDTYQYQAANWLANDDKANFFVPYDSIHQEIGYLYMCRYILALNYFAMGGPNWLNKSNFLSEDHICHWNTKSTGWSGDIDYEVDEDTITESGVFCVNNSPVYFLLGGNNLVGRVPSENGHLTSLRQFKIGRNDVSGPVPSGLCNLTDLTGIDLSDNDLSGQIPSCVGHLISLKSLLIGNNKLEGPVPSDFRYLSTLEEIDLSNNLLSGKPSPIFNALPKLKTLLAANNVFEGALDNRFLVASQSLLEQIDLSNNRFTTSDTLPTQLFNNMPKLKALDLSDNNLLGSMPEVINSNQNLQFLALHDNFIRGNITGQLANLEGLKHLDLSNNNFVGDIPSEIGKLSQLEFLSLAKNELLDASNVPGTFRNLINLKYLSLRSTNRKGPLPSYIDRFKELIFLDFSHNMFSGALPLEYYVLDNLEILMLSSNKEVRGAVPDSIGNWEKLRGAFLDGTGLTGSLDVLCPFITVFKHDILFADCGGDNPSVNCSCCQCCPSADLGCSLDTVERIDRGLQYTFQQNNYSDVISSAIYPNFQ